MERETKTIGFGDYSEKAILGDTVELRHQSQEVVKCQETGVLMLNIDADQLDQGDLTFIKKLGLTISNPDTDKPVALGVDFTENSFGQKVKEFFDREDDEDDNGFFDNSSSSGFGFGGMGSFGGFGGGGFGGFGGGGFGGGGAGRGF